MADVARSPAPLEVTMRRAGSMMKPYFGYDRLLNARTQLVLDYVWEQEKEVDREANIIEAGLRYQYTPLAVLAAGIGTGVGDDSPDLHITMAFQHSFNGWY